MSLSSKLWAESRLEGFSDEDIWAIRHIFQAMPWIEDGLKAILKSDIDAAAIPPESLMKVASFCDQWWAIARSYRETFKDAAKRKEIYQS